MCKMPSAIHYVQGRYRLQEGQQASVSFQRNSQLPHSLRSRKINELAEEVERLRSVVDRRDHSTPASSLTHSQTTHIQPQPPFAVSDSPAFSSHDFSTAASVSEPSSAELSRSIEHISLDKSQVNDLFQL